MQEFEIREAGRCAHDNMYFHKNHNGYTVVYLDCNGCNWKDYCRTLVKPAEDRVNLGRPLGVAV